MSTLFTATAGYQEGRSTGLSSKPASELWGKAMTDPVWHWEPTGSGAGTTGRLIHNVTGQCMRRVLGKWRLVKR
jgi:hypothetical protein